MEHYWRCSNLGYNDRVYITAFAFLNGLDSAHLIDSLSAIHWTMNLSKEIKIRDLYNYWNNPVYGFDRRSRYFTYCFGHNRICDLNHNVYRLRNNGGRDKSPRINPWQGGRGGAGRGRVPAFHC